ncbi:MAG: deoxynucleoside kinase [Ignavibacteriales bacterium CG07_land_8_20_14_0_80_59_12]|nr:MAG: deoxynucleoside kinase [Ignavibacteriales bacterium CG07_land_8_20_14_0_80_59_12]
MPSQSLFVAVAGNIGAGKSSLTSMLSTHFGWNPYYESVENNPYLDDFYKDMSRWSFNLQVYFLSNRFKYHKKMVESPRPVIQDRSIYEDAEIFARNLHDIGKMDDRDYENYVELYHIMTEYLKPPTLMIYLRASVDTLLKQISRRGRSFEQGIQREYLEQLNHHYESWIGRYSLGALLTIKSDDIDFVNHESDFERVVGLVREKLRSAGVTA